MFNCMAEFRIEAHSKCIDIVFDVCARYNSGSTLGLALDPLFVDVLDNCDLVPLCD